MHQTLQAVAAEIQPQPAQLRCFQPRPDEAPRQRNEFNFFVLAAGDFPQQFPERPRLRVRRRQNFAGKFHPAVGAAFHERAQIILMHEELDLRAIADERDSGRLPHLRHQLAEHSTRPVAIHEAGADDLRAVGERDFFNRQFCVAVKRTAAVERADGGNENNLFHVRRPRGLKQLFRAGHVHRVNFLFGERPEIIRAMHQCGHTRECFRRNVSAELKFNRIAARFRMARQLADFPAERGEITFDGGADVAVAAGDGANFFHGSETGWSAVCQPMRCALAITEKVICVAGMSGSTDASTM